LCEALPAPYGFERGRIPLKNLRTYEEEMGGEKKIGLAGTRKKLFTEFPRGLFLNPR
jgi:hypothetical protein